ncbi:cytochrome P450, partial [Auricularia subglabra TFB-10046 SS5]
MDSQALIILFICLGIPTFVIWQHRCRRSSLPYPPGPSPKWLIGNLFDMPSSSSWLRYSEWGKQYGEITYVNVFGKPVVILNSLEACKELLERRGTTGSGRPYITMIEMMGSSKEITPQQDTPVWRYQRRLTQSAFGPLAAGQYHSLQERHTALFLKKMLDPESDCTTELRYAMGKSLFAITYGLPPEVHFDEFMRMSDVLLDSFLEAIIPGRYLVETIPILRFVPSWFPGAGFKRYADYVKEISERHAAVYFDLVKDEMAAGSAPASFVAKCLEAQAAGELKSSLKSSDAEQEAVKWAAATMYLAGIHTTHQTITKFLTAMQLYPEVQRKAQEEIFHVVGVERLPTIADRQSLPYVNAVITETMRWHPSVATGIPHRMTKDDEYKGYCIPKDTTVIYNAWNLSLQAEDGSPLETPEAFVPERFLPASPARPLDPSDYVFGFGRRICPGRYIGEDMVFLMVVSLLATFTVSGPPDQDGKEVVLRVEWTGDDAVSWPC